MDVGIGLPSTIPGVGRDQLLEWARRAEARGFSTLGTIDRVVYPSHEPLIALAAAAAVTERIRLATTILLAPTRANGALLAKQAATLDVLSGGRLVLGVAVGRREDDFQACGVDFDARGRILDEMLDLWARIWAGEEFGSAGGIGPRPDDGRPAVMLGGWAKAAFTRAARHAVGWTGGNCTLEEFAEGTARLRSAWEAAAREGSPVTMVQPYYALGDGAEQAVERTLGDYYGSEGAYTDTIVARAATDAATVRENVRAFAEAGCDELIFFPCDPHPDQVDLLADALR
jgi:alkanesulfonate monooxygenase SsuD/methylene tetrahydromethanopterin reductase-like flavin-dependent oxidoreductase (luciferase family)